MKKLMFGMAVAAAGLAFGLESANTVGYTTRTVVPGSYNMLAIQFNQVGSDSDTANVSAQITTDLPAYDFGGDYDIPDFPAIWFKTSDTAAAYNKRFYYCYDSEEDLAAGWWLNAESAPTAADMLALGRGFWLIVPDDATLYPNASYSVTFNGQVPDLSSGISVPVCNGSYIIAANPFPTALDLSKIVASSGVPALDFGGDYDIPDFPAIWLKTSDTAAAYNKRFYYCYDSEEGLAAGWWLNAESAQGANDIPAGKAFWIVIPDGCLNSEAETLTFYP